MNIDPRRVVGRAVGLRLLGRGVNAASLVAPLLLAVLTVATTGLSPELFLARSLILLVCLLQTGSALVERLFAVDPGAPRAVASLVVAVVVGGTLATTLGLLELLRPQLFCGLVAVGALLASLSRGRGVAMFRGPSGAGVAPWERAAAVLTVAIAAAAIGHDLHSARYQPPGAALYDDVSYHLPAAVLWNQSEDLRMLRFDFGDRSTSFYPIGSELAIWMLLAGAPETDFLARWAQIPAAIGLLIAVWALAKGAGASAWGAFLAVLLSLGAPRVFPDLALSAGSDVWAAFFALASLVAIAPPRHDTARSVILFCLCLGALVGTKYLALLWLPWLAAAGFAGWVVGGHLLPKRPSARALLLTAAVLAFVVAGGFAYVRNLVTVANPIFPQSVSIAGRTLLKGWESVGLAERRELESNGPMDLGAFTRRPDMTGPLWRWSLVPLAVLLPLLAAVASKLRPSANGSSLGWRVALAAGPLWLIGVYSLQLHDHRDIRYALGAIPLAAVSLVSFGAALPKRVQLATTWTLSAVGLWVLADVRGGSPWVGLGLGLIAGAVTWISWSRCSQASAIAAMGSLLVAVSLDSTLARYSALRSRNEAVARIIEEESQGEPVTIAYVGENRPHFLHGNHLQNRVEVVPTKADLTARHYRWGSATPHDPFRGGAAATWFRNLRALEVDLVLVESSKFKSPEARWLRRRGAPLLSAARGTDWELWAWRNAVDVKQSQSPAPQEDARVEGLRVTARRVAPE